MQQQAEASRERNSEQGLYARLQQGRRLDCSSEHEYDNDCMSSDCMSSLTSKQRWCCYASMSNIAMGVYTHTLGFCSDVRYRRKHFVATLCHVLADRVQSLLLHMDRTSTYGHLHLSAVVPGPAGCCPFASLYCAPIIGKSVCLQCIAVLMLMQLSALQYQE